MIITRDKNSSHHVIDRLITDTIQSDSIQSDAANISNLQTNGNVILKTNDSLRNMTIQVPPDGNTTAPFVFNTGNAIDFQVDNHIISMDNDALKIDKIKQRSASRVEIEDCDLELTGSGRSVFVYGDGTRSFRLHCGGGSGAGDAYFDLSGYKAWFFRNNAGANQRAVINQQGAYSQSSDDRLKENEEIIQNGLEIINKIKPQIYKKKDEMDSVDETKWATESGVIAQQLWYEVQELRHLIYTDAIPDDNIQIPDDQTQDGDYSSWGDKPAMVSYDGLIPYLISAVKELKAEVDTLKSAI